MKIGIILYSLTGNTLSVAEKLQGRLTADGHDVQIDRFNILGDPRQDMNPEIDRTPDPSAYDAMVVAAPVRAFSLEPAMKKCLAQMDAITGKPVACLTTHHFPYAWMGAKQAISQMKMMSESKGGLFLGSGMVHWSRKDREKQISQVVDKLAGLFGGTGKTAI